MEGKERSSPFSFIALVLEYVYHLLSSPIGYGPTCIGCKRRLILVRGAWRRSMDLILDTLIVLKLDPLDLVVQYVCNLFNMVAIK